MHLHRPALACWVIVALGCHGDATSIAPQSPQPPRTTAAVAGDEPPIERGAPHWQLLEALAGRCLAGADACAAEDPLAHPKSVIGSVWGDGDTGVWVQATEGGLRVEVDGTTVEIPLPAAMGPPVEVVESATAGAWVRDAEGRIAHFHPYQLFEDDPGSVPSAVEIDALAPVVELRGRGQSMCARQRDGDILCEGALGALEDSPIEGVEIEGEYGRYFRGARAHALPDGQSVCALVDERLLCRRVTLSNEPTALAPMVATARGVQHVAAAAGRVCVAESQGPVTCADLRGLVDSTNLDLTPISIVLTPLDVRPGRIEELRMLAEGDDASLRLCWRDDEPQVRCTTDLPGS